MRHTNKGYSLTFENGFRLSVQFGPHNYSSNRDLADSLSFEQRIESERVWFCTPDTTAEIAILGPRGGFVPMDNDDVMGWVTPDRVLAIGRWLATVDPSEPIAFPEWVFDR